jgi:hypothetical protein
MSSGCNCLVSTLLSPSPSSELHQHPQPNRLFLLRLGGVLQCVCDLTIAGLPVVHAPGAPSCAYTAVYSVSGDRLGYRASMTGAGEQEVSAAGAGTQPGNASSLAAQISLYHSLAGAAASGGNSSAAHSSEAAAQHTGGVTRLLDLPEAFKLRWVSFWAAWTRACREHCAGWLGAAPRAL